MMGFVVIWKVWKWSPLAAAAADRAVPVDRPDVPRRQPAEGVRGRLGAAGARRHRDAADVHVAARQPAAVREDRASSKCRSTDLVAMLERKPPQRVPGTAVFLTSDPDMRADRADAQPEALQGAAREERHPHHRDRADAARRSDAERVRIEPLSETFSRVTLRFGFMEQPNVPKALAIARKLGWQFDIMSTSFFLSRRALKPAAHSGMPRWQDQLFIGLAAQRQRRHRLFPDSDRARGRGGNAGHDLVGALSVTLRARSV